jgi:hypothetical protein
VELEIDAFLPRAEYRHLTTVGTRVAVDRALRYQVPMAMWNEAATMLQERLGLRVEHWHLAELS